MTDWTIPTVEADFSDWHGGREWAAFWGVDLDEPGAGDIVRSARHALGDLLLPRYERQPHATVAFSGLIDVGVGYGPAELAQDLTALRMILPGAVELTATSWDSFQMVPYLGLQCEWLHRAHRVLTREVEPPPFKAHLTIGQYARRVPLTEPLALLTDRPTPEFACRRDELVLFRYRSTDISGPLFREGALDLSSGQWDFVPGSILAAMH